MRVTVMRRCLQIRPYRSKTWRYAHSTAASAASAKPRIFSFRFAGRPPTFHRGGKGRGQRRGDAAGMVPRGGGSPGNSRQTCVRIVRILWPLSTQHFLLGSQRRCWQRHGSDCDRTTRCPPREALGGPAECRCVESFLRVQVVVTIDRCRGCCRRNTPSLSLQCYFSLW